MSDDKTIILASPDDNGEAKKELPLKRYAVSAIMVKQWIDDDKKNQLEWRHLITTQIESENPDGAEWLGGRFFENDGQKPEGFNLLSIVAEEIK